MREAVVIAHGLYMNSIVMKPMELYLKNKGYKVYNYNYTTIHFNKEENIKDLRNFILKIKEEKIHFIGHSMGGLLIRLYLNKYNEEKYKRVVTIGTPHNTSLVAKKIKNSLLKFILGSAGEFILTENLPLFSENIEVGCIVGTLNVGPLNIIDPFSKEGDGTITIEDSKLEGCNKYFYSETTHTALIYNKSVYREVVNFLKYGDFL